MKFEQLKTAGLYLITPEPKGDARGWFARTYCKDEFREIGHEKEWVQLNHSFTAKKGTVRGMHYQLPPHAEIKMVRCIAGAVCDVALDIRRDSPTFLQWTAVELTAAGKEMIYIPEGFAHGFQALTDDVELIYHHSAAYVPSSEAGIRYDDPLIHISWPLEVTDTSHRDMSHPLIDNDFKGI